MTHKVAAGGPEMMITVSLIQSSLVHSSVIISVIMRKRFVQTVLQSSFCFTLVISLIISLRGHSSHLQHSLNVLYCLLVSGGAKTGTELLLLIDK